MSQELVTALCDANEFGSAIAVAQHIRTIIDGKVEGDAEDPSLPGNKFFQECYELHQQDQDIQLITKFLPQMQRVIAESQQDSDVQLCLTMISCFVVRLPTQMAQPLIKQLLDTMAAHTQSRQFLLLTSMAHLYNMALPLGPSMQLSILRCILDYAKATGQGGVVGECLNGKVNELCNDLDLGTLDQIDIMLKAADLLALPKSETSVTTAALHEAAQLRTSALFLVPKNKETEYHKHAANAIACFLRAPDVYTFDALCLPVVQSLKDDKKFKPYFELLEVALQGKDVARALKSPVVKEECIDAKALEYKMKLLGLQRVAEDNLHGSASFGQIQQELGISEQQVPELLFTGMGRKLLEVRIKNRDKMVTVGRVTHRCFGPKQWLDLEKDIHTAAERVNGIVSMSVGPPPALQAVNAAQTDQK